MLHKEKWKPCAKKVYFSPTVRVTKFSIYTLIRQGCLFHWVLLGSCPEHVSPLCSPMRPHCLKPTCSPPVSFVHLPNPLLNNHLICALPQPAEKNIQLFGLRTSPLIIRDEPRFGSDPN